MMNSKVTGVKKEGGICKLSVEPSSGNGESKTIEADVVLVAVGRKPNTEGLGLEVKTKKKNKLKLIFIYF